MNTYIPKRLRKTSQVYDAKIASCYLDYHWEREVACILQDTDSLPATHLYPPSKRLVYGMVNNWVAAHAAAAAGAA
jgi:hypothetical protein